MDNPLGRRVKGAQSVRRIANESGVNSGTLFSEHLAEDRQVRARRVAVSNGVVIGFNILSDNKRAISALVR